MFKHSHHTFTRWLTLSMGSILVTFGGFAYYAEVRSELHRLDRSLSHLATVTVAGIRYHFVESEWQLHLDDLPLLGSRNASVEHELAYVRWYDESGNLIQFWGSPRSEHRTLNYKAGFISLPLSDAEDLLGGEDPQKAQPSGTLAASVRQLTLPIYQDNRLLGYLQVATSLAPMQDDLSRSRLFLAIALPTGVGGIGAASYYFGRMAMRPIKQVHQQLQRFTANAAHELRTPLAIILSNAQVGLLADPDAEQQYRLENIVETTKALNSLLSQLLLLARQGGMVAVEDLQSLDLCTWIEPVVQPYPNLAQAHGLTFKVNLVVPHLLVKAHPTLLAQALRNLIDNAIKYTPDGGTVEISLLSQARYAGIEVKDTGVGIADSEVPYIFERFYRVNESQTPASEGFGLGLAIAHQLVMAQGGHLMAQSCLGKGSIFTIRLPYTVSLPFVRDVAG